MLSKGLKRVTSILIVVMFIAGCGTTPNNHDIEENNLNQPPINDENKDLENEGNEFNDQNDLNEAPNGENQNK